MTNSVYESVMAGLNEALDDVRSEKPILKRHKVTIEPDDVVERENISKQIQN